MGRAPCCDKTGVKKGPWSAQEDRILINYIALHGHPNWRALPKQAGLLRCGKSCRLRWINYLRPDIRRGNFTKEEEDAIINLHQILGNKWSAIAAKLPGRTDNEIKNVWHTHLKKRLKQDNAAPGPHPHHTRRISTSQNPPAGTSGSEEPSTSSEDSTATTTTISDGDMDTCKLDNISFPEIDESFWLEVLSDDHNSSVWDPAPLACFAPVNDANTDSTDFWYNLYTRAGDSPEF